MNGYTDKAQELIDLIGVKNTINLCKTKMKGKCRSTEKYDKWRKIKRYAENINISTLPIPNL
jgi:hypothetical protein